MAAVKLSIHNPLTSEAINVAKLTDSRKRKLGYFLGVVLAVCSVSLVSMSLGAPDDYSFYLAPSVVLLTLIFILFGLIYESPNFEEVPESDCTRLLEACKATPEGQKYRAVVLAQGRKFTEEEALLITNWAKEQTNRLACKELYDIPVKKS